MGIMGIIDPLARLPYSDQKRQSLNTGTAHSFLSIALHRRRFVRQIRISSEVMQSFVGNTIRFLVTHVPFSTDSKWNDSKSKLILCLAEHLLNNVGSNDYTTF